MSTLAEVLAAHQGKPAIRSTGQWMCACDWLSVAPNDGGGRGEVEWREHFAEAATAAGLAVVELPKETIVPTGWGDDCLGCWPVSGAEYPASAWPKRQVVTPYDQWLSPDDARSLASALLAAANAAEQVSR